MMYPKHKLLLLCIGLSLCFSIARAQGSLTDSLVLAVGKAGTKEKPRLLTQLAELYRLSENYENATKSAKQAADIALNLHDYMNATKAYSVLSNVYSNSQQFALLKKASDTTLVIAKNSHQGVAMAYGYYAQALLYNAIDNTENVTKYCQLGLKELEKTTDPYISAKIYYLLYALNTRWNDVKNVTIYAKKATESALEASDYNLLSNCYAAMSVAADYKYSATKDKVQQDSILYYLKKAVALYQEHPGSVAKKTYSIACVNTADYYLKYFPATDNVAKANAIKYANMAKEVLHGATRGQEIVASSLGILSEYARRDKNFALQEDYLSQAYYILVAQQTPYYYTLVNVATALANLYESTGNYSKALEFQKKVTEFNNKLFNHNQALNAQKLNIQYETEKKNNEMQILKERAESKKLQNYLSISVAIVSLLGLVFMFRSYHFKLRYSLQREKQLQLEKQDSELQIKLEKEEQARLRAEQQLMEAQQQQLKKEAMASVLQLEHKNQMLLHIKDKLTEGDPVNMQKILKEETMLDSDFEQAKLQIQQVHPNFFNQINDKAEKKLSLLDLKLCTYLYLKMDTRQIAQLMHVEAKSVRMSKYRIKQKLGLGKEEDLNIFLQKLDN